MSDFDYDGNEYVRELRAEVERLRAKLEWSQDDDAQESLKVNLAAANALLERFVCADSQWPLEGLKDEARAHLAAQPATAQLACPDCGGPLTPGRLLPDTLRCKRCAQPAGTPPRFTNVDGVDPARDARLRDDGFTPVQSAPGEAELARRGLKP